LPICSEFEDSSATPAPGHWGTPVALSFWTHSWRVPKNPPTVLTIAMPTSPPVSAAMSESPSVVSGGGGTTMLFGHTVEPSKSSRATPTLMSWVQATVTPSPETAIFGDARNCGVVVSWTPSGPQGWAPSGVTRVAVI
jgi:hypothetical protein